MAIKRGLAYCLLESSPKTDTVRFWGAPGVESPGEHLVSGDESGSFAESCLKTVADRRAKVFGCGGLLVFTL